MDHFPIASDSISERESVVFYRFNHPDHGRMTVRCTAEQLIAAINEYLPSNPERLARHFCDSAGPIGNLIYIASGLNAPQIIEFNDTAGRLIDE